MTEQKKKRNRLLVAAGLSGVAAAASLSAGFGHYLVSYALGRSGSGGNRKVSLDTEAQTTELAQTITANKQAQAVLTAQFLQTAPARSVGITSRDGLSLRGVYYANAESHLWALVVHGYRCDHTDMNRFAQHYYAQGYQVLTPDLRGCGESEGDYIGMGWLDRYDLLDWIHWILAQDPQANIVLHGVSMGAAAVMMTAGEQTPDAVVAFVEDCGYTSAWDVFSTELRLRFHLPEFPVLYAADLASALRAGYSFSKASAKRQVEKCEKPMLFIHGTADDFIPFSMEAQLYEAKPGTNKQKIVVPGAGHSEADEVLGDAYWEDVFAFLNQYL